ncbi:hypothetical protein WSK_0357 [Novosphingobium sp. Rr 2-17]|uniref:GIY-YIG nuclease family protein n=1 Tax=Novosphingobium sp. Rr 2-17 TaxID=555793 RepID=UPI0002699173|nr:GIY-YIG nuclease family protein [Novosphingobium sp. Rr 2-17]EIZ80965.1 hypothetical protein WSK_0357 [Novosphingobium sp. Rr 2-17]
MNEEERKAAAAAYKDRKVERGIYAVRCAPSGQIWVGSAPDLSTIQNRLWFTLRQGRNSHQSLQEAWTSHGPESFTFEVVQRIADDDVGYVRDRRLRDLLAQWVDEFQAIRI